MRSPKKPKSPKKPTGRAPGKKTATPAAQCAWSWQRFRCGPEPGCRLMFGGHWPRCDGKSSSVGTPAKNGVNGDAIRVTINNVTISGDMSALCCSLLLLAPLMYIGRAWSSRRRRMAAVPAKSKMSPRGSPRPRRRQAAAVSTPAVSTPAVSTKSKASSDTGSATSSTANKVYPWSPAAEHAAAAEEVDRRWRLVREEAAKIATPPPASPSRLPLLASRLPSFSDLVKDLTKPPELSAPVAVQHDAPMPPCLSGGTHRWVKEHLPPLLAAKQVRVVHRQHMPGTRHAWYVHSTRTVSGSTRPSKRRVEAVAPACIAYAWWVGCMVCALHMQEPRWGCRYCGVEVLTKGGRHPADPAANAVAAPQRPSAPAKSSTPKSLRKPVPPSPASERRRAVAGSPSLASPSSGGGEVRPRSAGLKLYQSSPHHPSRRQSAESPFAYTPN
jgi:hypothetical protein